MRTEVKKTVVEVVVVMVFGSLVSVVAMVGLYGLGLSEVFTSGDIPHKSDEELIANFQTHRAEFEQLLKMIMNDRGLERIDYDWTRPQDLQTIGVSQERVAEYRDLCRQIGVPRGFYAFHDQGIFEFISSARGLAVSGSSKGYLYSREPLPRVVDNLDDFRQTKEKPYSYPIFRHIEGNWYLFFDAN